MTFEPSDMDRFLNRGWTPTAADWERRRFLEGLIRETKGRLAKLRQDPEATEEEIIEEQGILEAAQIELHDLELHFNLL